MALQEFLTLFIFYTFAFKKQKVPACLDTCKELIHFRAPHQSVNSLRGRRLKGKGKGVLGAREKRGAREEEGREGNACQETIVFAISPTNYVCKNNATVND